MKLDELLENDEEARVLFGHLPDQAQETIRQTAGDIGTLAALRDHIINMVHLDGPFYAHSGQDCTKLEPELKAQWTKEHQA